MSTRAVSRKAVRVVPAKRIARNSYARLVKTIETANTRMLGRAAIVVNQALVLRNWLIGAYLVEYEQGGADRAQYGARLLDRLAVDLKARGLKGLDPRTLRDCRLLFQTYPQIRGTVDPEFRSDRLPLSIWGPLDPESVAVQSTRNTKPTEKRPRELTPELVMRFSWTQLLELVRIEDPWKRGFYENECLKGSWSKRQLQRQIESLLYERTGLSTNKRVVIRRAHRQEKRETIEDLIRDPYVLEFAGLAERPAYSESDLESALLDHLQRFLLELGAGFCFEARQFRISTNNRHHRVDLVFFHRVLRCHVLLELKTRAFAHADAGQMNFYVNWFKANMMGQGDNVPIGIILCSDKDHTEVEFATGGMDNRLFVSRYLTALPSAIQLKNFVERDRARMEPFVNTSGSKKTSAK